MTIGDRKKRNENKTLRIDIAELEQGPIHLDTAIDVEWLKERMSFCEYDAVPMNGVVNLDIQSAADGVWVRGKVFTNVKTACATCLKDIVIGIESMINSFLLPLSEFEKEGDKSELTPEDLDREYYDGETVCLEDMLGDAIMLELPMNPKCETSCPGLAAYNAPAREVTPSVDPRLAPLLGIRINKEN